MKILVIGKGGREHAFVKKFVNSSLVDEVYVAPGNAGIREQKVKLHQDDSLDSLLSLCEEKQIQNVFIGAEQYLALAYADAFRARGCRVIGPNQDAARTETSKNFCKKYLLKADIPTANSYTYKDLSSLKSHCEEAIMAGPLVLKWDHLASGKGVFICRNTQELRDAYQRLDQLQGDFSCLVEDYIEGKELSAFVYVEKGECYYFGSACDYKRRTSESGSPNTGGMGAFSPNRYLDEEETRRISLEYSQRLLNTLEQDGIQYEGFLFWGFMLADGKPYVLEINVRFGDPETQCILPRMKNDLAAFFFTDNKEPPLFSEEHCLHLVKVDPGYPLHTGIKEEIQVQDGDLEVFFAGVIEEDGRLFTKGGRILGLSGKAKNLQEARKKVYENHQQARFAQEDFREDIGC